MVFPGIYSGGGEWTKIGNEWWFAYLFWIKMLRRPRRYKTACYHRRFWSLC